MACTAGLHGTNVRKKTTESIYECIHQTGLRHLAKLISNAFNHSTCFNKIKTIHNTLKIVSENTLKAILNQIIQVNNQMWIKIQNIIYYMGTKQINCGEN